MTTKRKLIAGAFALALLLGGTGAYWFASAEKSCIIECPLTGEPICSKLCPAK